MVVDVLLLIFLIAPLSLFIHEMGHVLSAMIFRAEKSDIIIGTGRQVCKLRLGRLHVYVRLIFFNGGHSINEKTPSFAVKEKAWISAGGPLLNGTVAFLLFLGPAAEQSEGFFYFCMFNGYLAIVNSFPFCIKGRKSDGYRFFQYLGAAKS
ncbi:site-2 protease family protein [Halobacillus sp. K22]|uniref:site-2 protease family protein n=1 Tax=Halobacillus sp. K22 TaxID=3457431 RepID=UPI003FCE7497